MAASKAKHERAKTKDLRAKIREQEAEIQRLTDLARKYADEAKDLEDVLQTGGEDRGLVLRYEAAMRDKRFAEDKAKRYQDGAAEHLRICNALIAATVLTLSASDAEGNARVELDKGLVTDCLNHYAVESEKSEDSTTGIWALKVSRYE